MIKNGFLKFSADWCGPCRVVAPIVKKVADEYDLDILNVDVDQNPDLAAEYNIRSIPAVIAVKDGEPIMFKVGSLPEDVYVEMAEEIKKC